MRTGRPRLPIAEEDRLERRREQYRRAKTRRYERVRHARGQCSDTESCPLTWSRASDRRRQAPARLVVELADGRRIYYYPESMP